MNGTTCLRDGGIIRDDFDASLHRSLQGRHDRIGIVRGDGDGIDALSDQRIQCFYLSFGGRRGRAGEDDFGAERVAAASSAPFVDRVEEAVAQAFGDDADAEFSPGLAVARAPCGRSPQPAITTAASETAPTSIALLRILIPRIQSGPAISGRAAAFLTHASFCNSSSWLHRGDDRL